MAFVLPGSIWHSDQGKQYGAEQTRQLLWHKGFVLSMSRAGTPTETGTGRFWEGKISILR
jgi:putative transposase